MTRRRSLLALAAAGLLAGCSRGGATLPAAPAATAGVGVKTVHASADRGQVVRAQGELHPRDEAVLAPEVGGRLVRIHADVGDQVRRGQVLVELDDAVARAQVQQARAALAAAEAALRNAGSQHRRVAELAKGDAASAATLEQAEIGEQQAAAGRDQAAAALLAAETQLSKHVLRAPFDGVVTSRMKSVGEFVASMPPTPVIALVNVASVEVRVAVPEALVDLLAPGAVFAATVSPSGKPFQAKVRAIASVVEPGTRTVDVRADPVPPLFRELRPGAIVQVALGGPATPEAGLFLPAGVIQRSGGAAFVWAVVAEKAQRREVKVEPLDPGTVRVVSGLSAGDVVVAEAGGALAEGTQVRVLE
jgi:RND family efflux transporter MFP subunit